MRVDCQSDLCCKLDEVLDISTLIKIDFNIISKIFLYIYLYCTYIEYIIKPKVYIIQMISRILMMYV